MEFKSLILQLWGVRLAARNTSRFGAVRRCLLKRKRFAYLSFSREPLQGRGTQMKSCRERHSRESPHRSHRRQRAFGELELGRNGFNRSDATFIPEREVFSPDSSSIDGER